MRWLKPLMWMYLGGSFLVACTILLTGRATQEGPELFLLYVFGWPLALILHFMMWVAIWTGNLK